MKSKILNTRNKISALYFKATKALQNQRAEGFVDTAGASVRA